MTPVQKRQPQAGSLGGGRGRLLTGTSPPPPPDSGAQAVNASPVNRAESEGGRPGPEQASPRRIGGRDGGAGAGCPARMYVRRKQRFLGLTPSLRLAGLLPGEACGVGGRQGGGQGGRRGGGQPRLLPLMCIVSHLGPQSGHLASAGVAQLARVLRRSGPSPGLLPNAGSTLSASVTVTCQSGVGEGATVVPTCGVTGDGLERPGGGSWHGRAELVVVLTWGSTKSPHLVSNPQGRGPARTACQGSRMLVWSTPEGAETSPQHPLGVGLLGCGVTPLALVSSSVCGTHRP